MAERRQPLKPGDRTGRFTPNAGRMSENRLAWVQTYIGQFVILTDEESSTQAGQPIRLFHPNPNGRGGTTWDLTKCTEEELHALKAIFDTAFAWALPTVRQRDKDAQEAFDNGDDSHARIYRALPQLVYRQGPIREYSKSLLDGPSHVSVVDRADEPLDGDVRGDGGEVAELDSEAGQPEDNEPSADEPEVVRQVGGFPLPPPGLQPPEAG